MSRNGINPSDPWMWVDWGAVAPVQYVVLYTRDDTCGSRFTPYQLFLSQNALDWTLCASYDEGLASIACASDTVPGPGPFAMSCAGDARYAKLLMPGSNRVIDLREIQVYTL